MQEQGEANARGNAPVIVVLKVTPPLNELLDLNIIVIDRVGLVVLGFGGRRGLLDQPLLCSSETIGICQQKRR